MIICVVSPFSTTFSILMLLFLCSLPIANAKVFPRPSNPGYVSYPLSYETIFEDP
ncbi:hypothetical protein SAMN04488574_101474 [Bacillus sp. 71mf]|nr:hypothetical protein SAMN04488574_101474 [Bacillus sp. 71mf]SFS78517.1 hypothetical protein SAMN04488145_103303 [Bacillus sp. 103mf]